MHRENICSKRLFSGTEQDNFYMPTISSPEGERWCEQGEADVLLEPEMSNDGFKFLSEQSILYTRKNFEPKYKLTAGPESSINVNHFYCQPKKESE